MDYFLLILFVIICCLLLLYVLLKMDKRDKISELLENKRDLLNLYKFLISGLASAILVSGITYYGYRLQEKELEQNLLEKAPKFIINSTDDLFNAGYKEAYKLTNTQGMISYVTFQRYYQVSFKYKESFVKFKISFLGETNLQNTLENNWYFVPTLQNLDLDEIKSTIKEYIKNKLQTEDVYIDGQIMYSVDFLDYKNDRFKYVFSEVESKININHIEGKESEYHEYYNPNDYSGGFLVIPERDWQEEVYTNIDFAIDMLDNRNFSSNGV